MAIPVPKIFGQELGTSFSGLLLATLVCRERRTPIIHSQTIRLIIPHLFVQDNPYAHNKQNLGLYRIATLGRFA